MPKAIHPASRTHIGIDTRRSCTVIRTIPTFTIGTDIGTRIERAFCALGRSRLKRRTTNTG
jgi:hypothetical protein